MAAVNGHANGVNGHSNGFDEQITNSPRTEKNKGKGIGPDGYPRLPPISKANVPQRDDPYANSKLMTFRLAKHKQALLMKVL